MRLNVFLSWSGKRSRMVAKELHEWLQHVLQSIHPWMSDTDIHIGDRWAVELCGKLESHTVGIILVTPENQSAQWMLYEAGALSKTVGTARVCPYLLQLSPTDLEGSPLAQFQAAEAKRDGTFHLIRSLNEVLGEDKVSDSILLKTFEQWWPDLKKAIAEIEALKIDYNAATIPGILSAFSKHEFPPPLESSVLHFASGFESHSLYEVSTSVAKARFYSSSRMNRKLIDKEHWAFLRTLSERVQDGFDMRLLFLDPRAPEHVLAAAHHDRDFPEQLAQAVAKAVEVLEGFGLDPDVYCRTYECHRNMALTVADDCAMFTPIGRDRSGSAVPLTRSSFTVTSAVNGFGAELVDDFLDIWDNGCSISKAL